MDGNLKRSAWLLGASILFGFVLLGFFGREVYRQAPPIPDRITTADGHIIAAKNEILEGQQVWQSTGGQQLGSIWGHGAYQAPDWSADWLHREATALLEIVATEETGRPGPAPRSGPARRSPTRTTGRTSRSSGTARRVRT